MKKFITLASFAIILSHSAFATTTYTCTSSKTNIEGLNNYSGPSVYTFVIDGNHVSGTMSDNSGPAPGVEKFDSLQNGKMDFDISNTDLDANLKKMDVSYDSWDHFDYSFSFNSTGGTVDIYTLLDCASPTDDTYELTCSAAQN